MKVNIPAKVREQMRKAGRARAAQMTTKARREYGRKAWLTRIANATARQIAMHGPPCKPLSRKHAGE